MHKKKILLISRKYPPSVGGMQTYTRDLLNNLNNLYDVDAILLGGGQLNLLWFLPYAFLKSLLLNVRHRYSLVYSCDALLAPVVLFIKILFRVKVACTVHGLDITYPGFCYQKVIPPSVAHLDRVVCVSRNTLEECADRGIPRRLCVFIPNGINVDEYCLSKPHDECRRFLEKELGVDLDGKRVILTSGRLIARKGVDWFLMNVFPKLESNSLYFITGEGPSRSKIEHIIRQPVFSGRVMLLGRVGKELLKLLYNSADIFIMPNQKIKEDLEGFGIVALESSSCGTPVIANRVDGLEDAVLPGKTGWLVNYNDIDAFVQKIHDPRLTRQSVREQAVFFSWGNIIKKYCSIIEENHA